MRRSALAAAVTVAGTVGALLCAAADPAAGGSAQSIPASAATVVRLLTGDVVRVGTAGGRPSVAVVPAQRGGIAGQFQQVSAAGHQYVLPFEVRPLLGVLDRSLFDVTALAATGDSARLPVSVSFVRGTSPHVPGLTITARSATSAQGYLVPSATVRAALVRAATAALQPGGRAPSSLFGGVTRLAVRGTPSSTVEPHYPQVTLVIDVRDANGRPAAGGGFLGLINTDSARRFVNFLFYNRGEAKVSVPLGHYSAITDVASFDGENFTDAILPIADFTVTSDRAHVTVSAAGATAVPSVIVPRPASVLSESVEFDRSSRVGGSLGSSFSFDGSSDVSVLPTRAARVGALHWLTGWTLVHDTGPRYSYDLSFVDDGAVPADEAKSVQSFQLAAIDSRYYNDQKRDSQFVRTPIYPFQFGAFGFFLPLPTPVERTEYVYGGPSAIWTAALIADPTFRNPFGGLVDDDFRVYPQGARLKADWLRGVLAPQPPEQTSGDSFYFCPGCRSGHRMTVLLAPFVDTTPGHFGEVSDPAHGPATQFSLSRGRAVLASGADLIGATVAVPSTPAVYHVHLAVDRSADHTRTATSTVTDLTFASAAGDGAPLPSGWFCTASGTDNPCTVLPLLTARAPLPTDLYDRLPVGDSTFVLTIAPFAGAGPATIRSARVQTQVGSGPFTNADLEPLGSGRYQVTLHNPASAAGAPVTLRISAADTAGDAITQTTTAAYLVARG